MSVAGCFDFLFFKRELVSSIGFVNIRMSYWPINREGDPIPFALTRGILQDWLENNIEIPLLNFSGEGFLFYKSAVQSLTSRALASIGLRSFKVYGCRGIIGSR